MGVGEGEGGSVVLFYQSLGSFVSVSSVKYVHLYPLL